MRKLAFIIALACLLSGCATGMASWRDVGRPMRITHDHLRGWNGSHFVVGERTYRVAGALEVIEVEKAR